MLDIDLTINTGILKYFGLLNLGLEKIKLNDEVKFNQMVAIKRNKCKIHEQIIKDYLITFITERFKKTIMYKNLKNNGKIIVS